MDPGWDLKVVVLGERVAAAIAEHAAAAAPEEASGLLVGIREGAEISIERALHCANLAPPESRGERFLIDPGAVINVRRSLRGTTRSIVGFYHSHPSGEGALSAADRAYIRHWPETVWLIAARGPHGFEALRGWWLASPAEEPTEISLIGRPARRLASCPD